MKSPTPSARKLARQKNLSPKYMSDKLTKNYFETDFKTFLLSCPVGFHPTTPGFKGQSPLASDDSDDPDYFIDSSQSQSQSSSQSSQSSQSTQSSSSEGGPSPQKESSQ